MGLSPSKKSGSQTSAKSALLAQGFREVSKLGEKQQEVIAAQILDMVRDTCDPAVKRYQDLVELKYTRGLTPEEIAEVNVLEAGFQERDEEFYGPILARVRQPSPL